MNIPLSAIKPFGVIGIPQLGPENYHPWIQKIFDDFNEGSYISLNPRFANLILRFIRTHLTKYGVTNIRGTFEDYTNDDCNGNIIFEIDYTMPNGDVLWFFGVLDEKGHMLS